MLFAAALFSLPLLAVQPDLSELAAKTARSADGSLVVLVELDEPPVARYSGGAAGFAPTAPAVTGIPLLAARRGDVARYEEYLDARREDVIGRLRARIPSAEVGAQYRTVWNGFAVSIPPASVRQLAELPGVAAIHRVREYFPTLDASNPAMGAPVFWSALGGDDRAGAGMKIGIIDTGVDFSNPMFSDPTLTPPPGFPKGDAALAAGKVIVAKFFQSAADARDANVDLGHRTAQDLVGHGSHSAGVAAGSRVDLSGSGRRTITVSGVAPKAWIGNYRVFAPRAFDDNIIAAIEAAVQDGMDIINMSFGGDPIGDPLRDPIIRATQNAIAAGVVATISAGNSGPDASTVGYPGAAPDAITVGAASNAHYGLTSLGILVSAPGSSVPGSLASITGGACADRCTLPASPVSASMLDVDVVDGQLSGIACTSLPGGSLNGRIALVQRGTCTFAIKGQNVLAAGAIGMVIYNSDDPAVSNSGEQLFNPGLSPASVPALLVRRSDGLALKSFIGGDPTAASTVWHLGAAPPGTPPFAGAATPDRLTSFSSRGPTPTLAVKPDLATVGADSYAPFQDDSVDGEDRFPAPDPHRGASTLFDASGFGFAAGTSFSAPRTAGAAALVKQKNPGWTPALIKAALTETASRPADANRIGSERVMSRGSGDIDLTAAATVESLVLPTSASFGRVMTESTPFTLTATFTLKNLSGAGVTYAIEATRSAGDNFVVPGVEPSSVTLGPSEERVIDLRVTIGSGVAASEIDSEGFLAVSDGRMTIPEILYVPWWIRTVPLTPSEPYLRAINARGK